MPELPEVETIRRSLDNELAGLVVEDLWWDEAKMLQPSPEAVREAVVGASFAAVRRRAKLLIFELSGARHSEPRVFGAKNLLCQDEILRCYHPQDDYCVYLLIHLRLSGRLLFRSQANPADDYVHVKFILSEGKELRFSNARKFGYVKLVTANEVEKVIASYGPEPLDDLTLEKFREVVSKRKIAIKKLLLDQKAVSGIGNIYANDALWLAGVNPQQTANSLSASQLDSLFKAIEDVLREGLKTGGASDQWYRNAYGEKGSYQEHFKVYGRAGQPCLRCGTPIERIEVGGRGTFFCPKCQVR